MNRWNNKTASVAIIVAFLVGLMGALSLRDKEPWTDNGALPGTELSGAAHPESQQTARSIHWRVPVAFGTNLPALGDNILYVTQALRDSSAGRVDLEVFEPGMLVPPFSITESVRDGKIQAGYTWVGYDQGRIPATPLISAVPFGMEPWEFTAWYYEGEGRALTDALYAPHNIKPVLCGVIGPETAGWFRQRITTLDDFKGLKIRFAGLGGKILQKLGASVTLIPGGEIFQALEKGAIDATEFSMPAVDEQLGFDRVAKFNYFPGWHQTFTASHLVVNLDVWNSLAPEDQALIEMACTSGVTRNLSRGEALQGEIMAGFSDKGVESVKFNPQILRELRSVAYEVLEEEAAADEDFARIWASQKAFQQQYQNWKQNAYLPRDF